MSSPFLGEWTINSWTPDDDQVSNGIPTDGVEVGGTLSITPDPRDNALFRLQWPTQSGANADVSGLPLDVALTLLTKNDVSVRFGDTSVPCDVNVSLLPKADPGDSQQLQCNLNKAGMSLKTQGPADPTAPETGSGTFTATANGG
jgi:hypothetical protein